MNEDPYLTLLRQRVLVILLGHLTAELKDSSAKWSCTNFLKENFLIAYIFLNAKNSIISVKN